MIARRWALRGIGLVSTIILARLLAPADFGIIAMAMIVVGLLELLAEGGIDLALIRNPHATRAHFDTAWTFRIIQGVILALVLVAVAPLAAEYFNESRVAPVMRVLALRALIMGFENVGIVHFLKGLDFAKDFRFAVYRRLIATLVTLAFAVALRSYWALVIGMVVAPIASVFLSYVMHSYRPRLSLARVHEIWSFSVWIIVRNIGAFIQQKLDTFAVATFAATRMVGGYYIANDLAMQVAQNISMPLGRALLPGYAKASENRDYLGMLYLNSVGVVATLTVPFGLGMAMVSNDLVTVLLGEKWRVAIPLLEVMGIFAIFISLSDLIGTPLVALGRVRMLAILQWFQVILLAPLLLLVGYYGTTLDIALARTAFAFVFLIIMLVVAGRVLGLAPRAFIRVLWRPFVAGAVMAGPVLALNGADLGLPVFRLIVEVGVGGIVYIATSFLLWHLAGRPAGPESYVWKTISRWRGAPLGDNR